MAPLSQYLHLSLMLLSVVAVTSNSKDNEVSVQIVYMAKSKESAASHVQTLASVLGRSNGCSEMAAKKAIIYDYTRTLNGFAAKLTPEQINALLKQPAVLKILPGGTRDIPDNTSTP
ncbi:hypothetical protein HHK36_014542 [Tetracentron sinense]|uniref:Inhibitor I9 domain-containing protein n=1 Tax=Tetracentron sinense TaxID=13715 RepID=A0A835DFD2_TETSI|nr:hypothetical protein HHK36_014542 [Tetracentron sinense]